LKVERVDLNALRRSRFDPASWGQLAPPFSPSCFPEKQDFNCMTPAQRGRLQFRPQNEDQNAKRTTTRFFHPRVIIAA
jgi:hypothetical protein